MFGQATDVVVALDGDGFLALGTARLDDIGVNRALRQKGRTLVAAVTGFQFGGLGLEHIDKQAADDFALFLGVADPSQLA